MKTNRDFRGAGLEPDDLQRGTKLAPMKKSGKERHTLYGDYEDDGDMQFSVSKRESVLDYYDDGSEDL